VGTGSATAERYVIEESGSSPSSEVDFLVFDDGD
jgi:hypothetical protein